MVIAVKDDTIQIDKMSLGPFGTNCYIVTCLKTKASALVDAPAEADTIIEQLQGTEVKYILMTHNHMDHTGALAELHSRLGVPLAAHKSDSGRLPAKPDMFLADGETLSVGDLRIDVIHTPGHTPGCICFRLGNYLLSGDTIFNAGPGRTGSPAAFKKIIESITTKIFTLPDETQIFPGHGDSTVLKKEKDEYAVFASKTHSPDLCGDIVWLES
jgi:hydroxyacylglutathione hydrolase